MKTLVLYLGERRRRRPVSGVQIALMRPTPDVLLGAVTRAIPYRDNSATTATRKMIITVCAQPSNRGDGEVRTRLATRCFRVIISLSPGCVLAGDCGLHRTGDRPDDC